MQGTHCAIFYSTWHTVSFCEVVLRGLCHCRSGAAATGEEPIVIL